MLQHRAVLALFVTTLCFAGASAPVHHKFTVDPNEIKLIPADAASSFLVPYLTNALDERTNKPLSCTLDEGGISCAGLRYPLTQWRLLENAFTFTESTGGVSVCLITRDSHFRVGPVFGPTHKGLSLILKTSGAAEATHVVSALKSLGITSFPGAPS